MLKSLFPSRQQWKGWTIPSRHTALGLLIGFIGLVLTVVFGLPPFIDYLAAKRPRVPIPTPAVEYGLVSLAERYEKGLLVHGVEWRSSFSRHSFIFGNASTNTPIEQVRLLLLLPAGIVRYSPVAAEDCQGVTLSQYNPPTQIRSPDGKVHSLRQTFRNDLLLTASKINPGGRLRFELVLEYRGKNDDAGWCDMNYSFGNAPHLQRVASRNRIIVGESDPLSLRIDQSTNYISQLVRAQLVVMPDPPIAYVDGVVIDSADLGFPALPNANQPLIPPGFEPSFGDTKEWKVNSQNHDDAPSTRR